MKADYIKEIIRKMEELPYKAILFDGVWGIGKSYAIDEALKDNDNVCKISMFSLNNASQIYREILFQLALKKSAGGKISKMVNSVMEGLSAIGGKVGQAKKIIRTIAKERELFLLLSKGFHSLHIVVIDDMERMSGKVSLEEVFGIVEELKRCPYTKVILVANTEEIKDENKELFDKYHEKVIDRAYHITEMPGKVDWGKLKIHAGFITEFLKNHKVKNLRTLEKAQRFFDDVKLCCNAISDEQFMDEIRLICFAIVVESTDGLYLKEPEEDEGDPAKKDLAEIYNAIEHRLVNYLRRIMSGENLMTMLLHYYQDNEDINIDGIDAEYRLFLEAGKKANYYKTDKEIKEIMPNLRNKMNMAQNLVKLNKFADEYMIWADIICEETSAVLEEYRISVQRMLQAMIQSGEEKIMEYDAGLFRFSSEKVRRIYTEEIENARKAMVKACIEYLQKTTKGNEAFEYSRKLRNYYKADYYRDIINKFAEGLYDRKSFPVDEIDEVRYRTCYNIMYVLHEVDGDRFLQYCDELSQRCDHMSAHRVEVLVKEIIKGY